MWLFLLHIGRAIKKNLKLRIKYDPEMGRFVSFQEHKIVLFHPLDDKKWVSFQSSPKQIIISTPESSQSFHRSNFSNNYKQEVADLVDDWITSLIGTESLSVYKPKMEGSQIAVMHIDYSTGHVLTTNLNPPSYWGETYRVFENIQLAKEYCKTFPNKEIEFNLYDAQYEYLENIRPSL